MSLADILNVRLGETEDLKGSCYDFHGVFLSSVSELTQIAWRNRMEQGIALLMEIRYQVKLSPSPQRKALCHD
jgi:hypothetical protein